jgi:GntR family transcriptional regulator
MIIKPNPSLGVPIYLQLVEQVKHAIETGALRAGDQLPSIRPLAEELVINANTVAKAYRELEREGIVELRQGAGAFIANTARARHGGSDRVRGAQPLVAETIEQLRARGLSDEEIRRLFEAELQGVAKVGGASG